MSNKPWHKRYHGSALNGYMTLSLEERGAYTTLLDMMYDQGRPLEDNERLLAGYMGVSLRKYKSLRDVLISKGKIEVNQDGKITNKKVEKVLSESAILSEKRAKSRSKSDVKKIMNGDEKSLKTSRNFAENELKLSRNEAENEKKPNKNNDPQEELFNKSSARARVRKNLDNRYTNTDVLEEGPSERTVFKDGLKVLQTITGKKESECRSVIGKWINKSCVPDGVVLAMIDEAAQSGKVDPVAWITKQISKRAGLSMSVDDPDHKIIFDAWDDMARKNGLPVIQGVAPRRTDNLNQILSKFPRDKVLHAISCIPSSEFLLGKSGWRISIDDFLKPDTFLKVLEGGFSDRRSSAGCLSQEQQRARMNIFVERGVWHPTWGGKPGESNCSVSVEIQREFSNQEVML